jgi:hypothetical protein
MATHFWKAQTVGSYFPPTIHGHAEGTHVCLTAESGYSNDAEAPLGLRLRREVYLRLTSHEAMALAAWLSEQAEKINRKAVKAAERRAARAAAKGGRS